MARSEKVTELYETLAIPMSALDWKSAGRLFKDELGRNEAELAEQFEQLLENGYRVLNFNIVGTTIFFVFEKI